MLTGTHAVAKDVATLNDLEIAHVAYTADNIDIRYAHLALALTSSSKVRTFPETMIRDHTAVNTAALDLLAKLNAQAQDNFLSQTLNANAEKIIDDLSALRGAEFDGAMRPTSWPTTRPSTAWSRTRSSRTSTTPK
jgi:putative membrane protein